MESHDVIHDEIKLVNAIPALSKEDSMRGRQSVNEAQNARFNEFSRRTEQQFLDLTTALLKHHKYQRGEKKLKA